MWLKDDISWNSMSLFAALVIIVTFVWHNCHIDTFNKINDIYLDFTIQKIDEQIRFL